MEYHFELFGQELTINYEYKITNPGAPETGPSYSSGGEPAEPMEYEIQSFELFNDKDEKLEVPKWLNDIIETHLSESDKVYEDIDEDSADCGNDYDERD